MEFADIIKPSKYHRTLVGIELTMARERFGITAKEFAELCGWSQPQQSRFENGENEVHIDITNKIAVVLISLQKS